MMSPRLAFAPAVVFAALSCAIAPEPGYVRPAFAGEEPMGVQIWSGFDHDVHVDVVASNVDAASTIRIAENVLVPCPRREMPDPSLGGDPAAQAQIASSLPPGRWTITVRNRETGALFERPFDASANRWMIVFASSGSTTACDGSGPALLE